MKKMQALLLAGLLIFTAGVLPMTAFAKNRVGDIEQTIGTINKAKISFVFDDGGTPALSVYYPIFKKYGYTAAIAPIAGRTGELEPSRGAMSGTQIKQLYDAGWEVISHSWMHYNWNDGTNYQNKTPTGPIPDALAYQECRKSKDYFNKLGIEVYGFAMPDESCKLKTNYKDILSDSYLYCLANPSGGYDVKSGMSVFDINRGRFWAYSNEEYNSKLKEAKAAIDIAIANKQWLVLYHHADSGLTETLTDAILQYIHEKNGTIDVVNPCNVVLNSYAISSKDAKAQYTQALEKAEQIKPSGYTADSYKQLQTAIQQARALGSDSSKTEYAAQALKLNQAVSGLIKISASSASGTGKSSGNTEAQATSAKASETGGTSNTDLSTTAGETNNSATADNSATTTNSRDTDTASKENTSLLSKIILCICLVVLVAGCGTALFIFMKKRKEQLR